MKERKMLDAPNPIIRTKRLSKVYADGLEVRALSDVDFAVRRGEFVAVMGPSGSGKSTLLNLVGTLDTPTSGNVEVDGVEPRSLSSNALADFRRAKIGFVFQLFSLIPTLTALENVMLPLIPYRKWPRRELEQLAGDLLAAVGMADRTKHLPGQLSGGEQQRAAIARALVNEPAIILADEPTGNLDTRAGDEFIELLERVREERDLTLVLASHSPRVAAYASRAIFLGDGRIVDECELATGHELELIWKRLASD
jgi:ABC-type lipoprotein export system ATPase subunit